MFARRTAQVLLASVGQASRTLSPGFYQKRITSNASVALYLAPPPFPLRQDFATCGVGSIATTFSVHGIGTHITSRSGLFMMDETFTLLNTQRLTGLRRGRGISVNSLTLVADTFTILCISSRTPSSSTDIHDQPRANKSPLPTGFSSTVSPQPLRFRPAAGLYVRPNTKLHDQPS